MVAEFISGWNCVYLFLMVCTALHLTSPPLERILPVAHRYTTFKEVAASLEQPGRECAEQCCHEWGSRKSLCMGHFYPRGWTVLRTSLNMYVVTYKGLIKRKKLSRNFGQSKLKFHVFNSTLAAFCSQFKALALDMVPKSKIMIKLMILIGSLLQSKMTQAEFNGNLLCYKPVSLCVCVHVHK